MTPTRVDFRPLRARLQKLAILEDKTGPQVLRDQGRLLTRDLISFTPPTSRRRESLAANRKRGNARVRGDIGRLWRSAKSLARQVRSGGSDRAARWLERYIRTGDVAKFEKMATDLGLRNPQIMLSVSEADHDQRRSKLTGHAIRIRQPILVLRENSIKKLLRTKLSHVGTAKGGWIKAGDALGVSIPQWIRGHSKSVGLFTSQLTGPKKSITIGNLVPFAQKYGGSNRLIEQALKHRQRAIDLRIKHLLKGK